jgi:hypothetical protein
MYTEKLGKAVHHSRTHDVEVHQVTNIIEHGLFLLDGFKKQIKVLKPKKKSFIHF